MDMMTLGLAIMAALGNPNPTHDVLGVVDTKAYWRTQKVTVSAETMLAELDPARSTNGAPADKTRAVRRLMAIRALGELKAAKATPALRGLLASKEMFVADYAARAIAAIEGKPAPRTALWESPGDLKKDLGLIPAGAGAVIQSRTLFVSSAPKPKKLAAQPPASGVNLEQIQAQLTATLTMVVHKVGNIRIDAVTVGVSSRIGDDTGWVVAVARGAFDAKAVAATLKPLAKETTKAHGKVVIRFAPQAVLVLLSDRRAVLVTSPGDVNQAVLEKVIAAIKTGAPGLGRSPKLAALARIVRQDAPIWSAMAVSDSYRQAPVFAPFDTVVLTSKRKPDGLGVTIAGTGKDPDAVARYVKEANADVKSAITELGRTPPASQSTMAPLLSLLKSVRVRSEGAEAILTASLGRASPTMVVGGWLCTLAYADSTVESSEICEDATERVDIPEEAGPKRPLKADF